MAAISGNRQWPIHAGNNLRLERVTRAIDHAVIPLFSRALQLGERDWAVASDSDRSDVQR